MKELGHEKEEREQVRPRKKKERSNQDVIEQSNSERIIRNKLKSIFPVITIVLKKEEAKNFYEKKCDKKNFYSQNYFFS